MRLVGLGGSDSSTTFGGLRSACSLTYGYLSNLSGLTLQLSADKDSTSSVELGFKRIPPE